MKTLIVRNRNQVTLPKEMLADDVHEFEYERLEDGSFHLIPMFPIPASQRYFWTKRWQAGERMAEEDFEAGRVRRGTVQQLMSEVRRKQRARKSR